MRDAYLGACGNKRTIVKAGDKIPLKGLQVDIIASTGGSSRSRSRQTAAAAEPPLRDRGEQAKDVPRIN